MLVFFTKAMMLLHMFVGVILIGIILLQRGRGGGLAGAFGGMGGQSAFGTKAGDVFTKITIYIATFWIVLGCICVVLTSNHKSSNVQIFKPGAAADIKKAAPEDEDSDKKADDDSMLPAPGNPPPLKTNADTKTEGESSKDKAESDKSAPAASKEGDATDKKPEASDKPAESKGEPTEPKDK